MRLRSNQIDPLTKRPRRQSERLRRIVAHIRRREIIPRQLRHLRQARQIARPDPRPPIDVKRRRIIVNHRHFHSRNVERIHHRQRPPEIIRRKLVPRSRIERRIRIVVDHRSLISIPVTQFPRSRFPIPVLHKILRPPRRPQIPARQHQRIKIPPVRSLVRHQFLRRRPTRQRTHHQWRVPHRRITVPRRHRRIRRIRHRNRHRHRPRLQRPVTHSIRKRRRPRKLRRRRVTERPVRIHHHRPIARRTNRHRTQRTRRMVHIIVIHQHTLRHRHRQHRPLRHPITVRHPHRRIIHRRHRHRHRRRIRLTSRIHRPIAETVRPEPVRIRRIRERPRRP